MVSAQCLMGIMSSNLHSDLHRKHDVAHFSDEEANDVKSLKEGHVTGQGHQVEPGISTQVTCTGNLLV